MHKFIIGLISLILSYLSVHQNEDLKFVETLGTNSINCKFAKIAKLSLKIHQYGMISNICNDNDSFYFSQMANNSSDLCLTSKLQECVSSACLYRCRSFFQQNLKKNGNIDENKKQLIWVIINDIFLEVKAIRPNYQHSESNILDSLALRPFQKKLIPSHYLDTLLKHQPSSSAQGNERWFHSRSKYFALTATSTKQ